MRVPGHPQPDEEFRLRHEADRIHYERLAVPVTDRVPGKARIQLLVGWMSPPAGVDAPNDAILENDGYSPGAEQVLMADRNREALGDPHRNAPRFVVVSWSAPFLCHVVCADGHIARRQRHAPTVPATVGQLCLSPGFVGKHPGAAPVRQLLDGVPRAT